MATQRNRIKNVDPDLYKTKHTIHEHILFGIFNISSSSSVDHGGTFVLFFDQFWYTMAAVDLDHSLRAAFWDLILPGYLASTMWPFVKLTQILTHYFIKKFPLLILTQMRLSCRNCLLGEFSQYSLAKPCFLQNYLFLGILLLLLSLNNKSTSNTEDAWMHVFTNTRNVVRIS